MKILRVPKREVPVRILMDNGQVLEGNVYAATRGPDGEPGRVVDRLNETGEDFLPLACADDRILLNKSGIVAVQVPEGRGEVKGLEDDGGKQVPVRITLVGGTSLVGRFFVWMPPERARVLDFLNAAPRFVPLLGDEHVTLVQRSYILCVRNLTTETP